MKKPSRADRYAELHKLRAEITPQIVALEKKYGATAVGGAFARHQQIRRERGKLARAKSEIERKIAKLER